MSGLFKKPTVSQQAPVISSLRVGTSCYGRAIPLIYGKSRVATNLIWYSDFTQIAHTSSQSVGGKGGGGSVTSTSYTYTAAVIAAICQGPVVGTGNDYQLWVGKSKGYPSDFAFNEYIGDTTQTPWGYLTTNHPTQALAYRGIAYIAAAALDLGGSPSMPTISAAVTGFYANIDTGTAANGDANPANVIYDLLTNTDYGVGVNSAQIGDLTAIKTYCIAQNLLVSPAYTEQKPARDLITSLAAVANTGVFFSEGVIKFVPHQDFAVTGNGVTYTPNMTPLYDLTDDQFIIDSSSDDPVKCMRKAQSDCYNQVQVNYVDRSNEYNDASVDAKDQNSIDLFGVRIAPSLDMKEIADASIARTVAQQALQRSMYIRNTYEFKLGWAFCLLEPMDIVTLTDSALGLNRTPVRITDIEEDDRGTLTIKAEELPIGSVGASKYTTQNGQGFLVDVNSPASNANNPIIWEPPVWLAGESEVWMAVNGIPTSWGGCFVWLSYDNTTYKMVGSVTTGARYGSLTATLPIGVSPDTTNTLSVSLMNGSPALLSGNTGDADALNTLCYVGGEYLAYQTATLTGTSAYNLTYLVRGAYGSAIASHAIGTPFARLDNAIFKYPYQPSDIGKTVYIKLQSFNPYGFGTQDLAGLTPYTYTIQGTAYQFPTPINPKVFWSADPSGHISRAKVTVQFSKQFDMTPDGLLLMYSVADAPNQVGITSGGTTSTLTIGSADLLWVSNPGDFTVQAGSSRTRLILRDPTNPLPTNINLGGHWWAETSPGSWNKVTSYDATSLYFQSPLDADPVVGATVNIAETSWADERSQQFRYAMLTNGGQQEIIRWGGVQQVGGPGGTFQIQNCLRGQEGTTVISADGGTFGYFPAPGVGTNQVVMPLSSFRYEGGVWISDMDVDMTVPIGKYLAISCVVYKQSAETGILRSNLVPVTYGGAL